MDLTVLQYQMIYLGRHNWFEIALRYNDAVLSSAILKIEIKYKTLFISSSIYPSLFNFSEYATTGKISVDLSGLSLPVGTDDRCEIIAYTEDFSDTGIVCTPFLSLEVSSEVLGDATLMDLVPYSWQPNRLPPLTIEDADCQMVLADFNRSSIRMQSDVLRTVSFPVMTADYNGARMTFFIKGTGGIDIVAYDGESTTFGDLVHTKISGAEQFSAITLEYDADLDMFHVVDGVHHWNGGMIA